MRVFTVSTERIIKYLLIIIINDNGPDLYFFMTGVVWLASIDCRYQRQIRLNRSNYRTKQ